MRKKDLWEHCEHSQKLERQLPAEQSTVLHARLPAGRGAARRGHPGGAALSRVLFWRLLPDPVPADSLQASSWKVFLC